MCWMLVVFPPTIIWEKSLNVQLYETINPSGSTLPAELKTTGCPAIGLGGEKLITAVGNSSGPALPTLTPTIVEFVTTLDDKLLTTTRML